MCGYNRSDELRRSSFGDREHPAWKSAESYHNKPEYRRSFDSRMPAFNATKVNCD